MTSLGALSAHAALERLRDGNGRYVAGVRSGDLNWKHAHRLGLQHVQRPFATVLGCSDSRVPLEAIFDQGLGDLFVVRVAGNIAGPTQIGSIEFAVARFGTPLIVVLGHSGCGAVAAALDGRLSREGSDLPHFGELVRRIEPIVEAVRDAHPNLDRGGLQALSVREKARANAAVLGRESSLLARRVADGRLRIVGAEYALESGEVRFLES